MHKKRITYIFLLIGLLSIFGTLMGAQRNFNTQSSQQPLRVPSPAELSNSTITYTKEVERVTQIFRVKVNLTGTAFTIATKVNMTISYSNATQITYDLTETETDVWSFSKSFSYQAPLGTQRFHLYIWNVSTLLEDSDDQDFKIKNSPPRMGFNLSNTSITRNNTIFFNITPTDAETPFYNLIWSWQLLFGAVLMNSSGGLKEITNLSHHFPTTTTNSRLGIYTLKGTVTDLDGLTKYSYATFNLTNNLPRIKIFNTTWPDELNPDQIYRKIDTFRLDVNVTDVEAQPNAIDLAVLLHKPTGETVNISTWMHRTDPSWHFNGLINLSSLYPVGTYTCEIIAYETINAVVYSSNETFDFTLLNNEPEGNVSYTINGDVPSGIGLRIKEFDTITFAINVTGVDVEGVEIVRIKLLSPDGKEFIYPLIPVDDYVEYTISARNLAYGQWYSWIYVIDEDGVEVQSTLSLSFDILPEKFGKVLPWIMLAVGAVIAFGISMAVVGTKYINLRRDFDNLLSRTGEYKKPDSKNPKTTPKQSPTSEKTEESSTSAPEKKKSITKKHELFRKIKK